MATITKTILPRYRSVMMKFLCLRLFWHILHKWTKQFFCNYHGLINLKWEQQGIKIVYLKDKIKNNKHKNAVITDSHGAKKKLKNFFVHLFFFFSFTHKIKQTNVNNKSTAFIHILSYLKISKTPLWKKN